MRYMTIDPGVQGTGFALWDFRWRLIHCGVINAPGKYSWEQKMVCIAKQLTEFNFNCKCIYIEYPQKFKGVGGDMLAATGDLGKLFTFVGFVLGYLKCEFELVPVLKWKGQLPKNIVNQRIKKALSPKELKLLSEKESHDWDAVGIGLYMKGEL